MTLAICVPVPGLASETFIRRHVEGLAPVAIVARRPAEAPAWECARPTLWLDDLCAAWGGEEEQRAIAEFLDGHGVRAVLAEYLDVWVGVLPALLAGGRRVVAHGHGYDVTMRLREPWWRDAYRAFERTAAVVTMSHASRDRLRGEAGLPDALLHVIPYGVPVPPAPPPRARAERVRCLAVGRLVAKKAPQLTAEAVAAAAAGGAAVELWMVGEGPLRDRVEATGGPVTMLGAMVNERVIELMQVADVFVQHSVVDPDTGDEEGLPVAILEAMAHGLPVVATRHAGIPEAVVDGETGILVEEGDVEAMAAAIARLAADPRQRARMGAAGHARARERFSIEAETAALREVLAP